MDKYLSWFYHSISSHVHKISVSADYDYAIVDFLCAQLTVEDVHVVYNIVSEKLDELQPDENDQDNPLADLNYLRHNMQLQLSKPIHFFRTVFDAPLHKLQIDLKEILCKIHSQKAAKIEDPRSSDYFKRLSELAEVFKLDPLDCDLTTFFYLLDVDNSARYLQSVDISLFPANVCFLSAMLDRRPSEIRRALKDEGKLRTANIFLYDRTIRLNDSVFEFLAGVREQAIHESLYKRDDFASSTLPLDRFFVNQNHVDVLKMLINGQKGKNILIYGRPGTGKTEFVRAFLKEHEAKAYFLGVSDKYNTENLNFRKMALYAAANNLEENDILVIDECDRLLSSYGDGHLQTIDFNKAWINSFLENSKLKSIWITNHLDDVVESTRRRFSYSISFPKLNFKQRLSVFKNQVELQNIDILEDKDIEELANQFDINAGGIALALRDLRDAKPQAQQSRESFKAYLHQILKEHQQLLYGQNKFYVTANRHYSLEGLHTDVELDEVVSTVDKFYQYISDKEVTELDFCNLNILLQGRPGTGKTEFVKYLGQALNRNVVIKRASDILSKWVGDTEKNIRAIFDDISGDDRIFFIDEIDSLLFSRSGAQHSWEVSQTNEFLASLENYRGVFICATNFTEKLDHAVTRRFQLKVLFKPLSSKGKLDFFMRFFGKVGELSPKDQQVLSNIDGLTPGDFAAVYRRWFFKEDVSTTDIITALAKEVEYKEGRSISLGR